MLPHKQKSKAVWITRLNPPGDRLELTASRYVHSYLRLPKGQYGPQKSTMGRSCKTRLNSPRAAWNWPLACKVHSQVQDQRSHQVQYSIHTTLSLLSLLPCCFYQQIYVAWIQTYICSLNAHMLYLLYGRLKIFSVGMAHSVYLLGCGIQDRGYVGRFQEVLSIFSSPKYPDRPWAHLASLEMGENYRFYGGNAAGAWSQTLASFKYRG
jgi:hypothetical protein